MSVCRVVSCVAGSGCFLWPVHSLGKTLLTFSLLHFVCQRQNLTVTPGISWLPTFAFQSPIMKRTPLFLVLVLECLVGLQRIFQLQLLWHRLGLLWYWMVSLGNEQKSFYCFLDCNQDLHFDSFVDYEGYSISSKGFLPMVVDIEVIWVKFTHSSWF